MKIDEYIFGSFVVDGKRHDSDIKIINNEVKPWHNHHLSVEDLKDIALAKPKPSIVVIGTGNAGILKITKEVTDFLKNNGFRFFIDKTPEACRIYNKFIKVDNVAAVLHSTC